MAASAPVKSLYSESKQRLSERVQGNINNVGSMARQVARGSKAAETLSQATRNLVLQDYAIENTQLNLKRMEIINSQLKIQLHQLKVEEVESVSNRMDRCLVYKNK